MNNLLYLIGIPFIAITAWIGYFEGKNLYARYYVLAAIAITGILSICIGLLMIGVPLIYGSSSLPKQTYLAGWMFIITGATAIPSLIAPLRHKFSKTLFPGINPDSVVHTWALYIFLAVSVMSIFMITVLYDPEAIIESLKDTSLKVMASTNAAVFILFSFIAAGIWINGKSLKQTAKELGIISINRKTILKMTGIGFLLAIFIQVIEGFLISFIDPQMHSNIERVMQALKTTGTVEETFISALIVGITAGIGEELLFRGLMQPLFGVFPTALLFVLIHTHYGPTILLAELLFLGIILGLVRKRSSTTAAIIVHGSFDFFVIVSSLLPS